MRNSIMATLLALFCSLTVNAQSTPSLLERDGKVYVVVAVVVIIVAGLFIYLLNLDKKITKLEQRNP